MCDVTNEKVDRLLPARPFAFSFYSIFSLFTEGESERKQYCVCEGSSSIAVKSRTFAVYDATIIFPSLRSYSPVSVYIHLLTVRMSSLSTSLF